MNAMTSSKTISCWQRSAVVRNAARSHYYRYRYTNNSDYNGYGNGNKYNDCALRSYNTNGSFNAINVGNTDTDNGRPSQSTKLTALPSTLLLSLPLSSLHQHQNQNQCALHPFFQGSLSSSAIITRSFSTGHPEDNNSNQDSSTNSTSNSTSNNSNSKTRNLKIKNAAKRSSVAVQKGATSIQQMIKKYGSTFVATYFSIYLLTLSSLFTLIDTGLIDPSTLSHLDLPWHSGTIANEQDAADAEEIVSAIDMIAKYMKLYSWTEPYAELVKQNPHSSNLAIAWVATKLTEPVRIGVTFAIVPRISKLMGRKVKDKDGVGEDNDTLNDAVKDNDTTINDDRTKKEKEFQ